MSNYRRAQANGGTYFFTVVTHQRRPILTDPDMRSALRAAIEETRARHPFQIDAWVLLPDHLHATGRRCGLPKTLGTDQSAIHQAGEIKLSRPAPHDVSKQRKRESTVWQRRYWERQIRDDADFQRHVDYMHYNPVKHGLVRSVSDWPHSTFHNYVARGVYPPD